MGAKLNNLKGDKWQDSEPNSMNFFSKFFNQSERGACTDYFKKNRSIQLKK